MKRSLVVPAALLLFACGPNPALEPEAQAPTPPPTVASAPPPADTAPKAAPEPTPEEKKKAEAKAKLDKDYAKLRSETEAEKARWTPELKAEAKALTEKSYPTGKAAIAAAMAGKHRRPGRADRDKYRHPDKTLEFFGLKPTMTVVEWGPGDGWYTELLAPALAKKGKLIATNGDPNGPADARSTYYAQRYKTFLDTAPDAYGKVEVVQIDDKAPNLNMDGKVDMVFVSRELHGMHNSHEMDAALEAIHTALKPNGVLAIIEHRAKADANPDESAKKGYLPEKWVIEHVEQKGFKLAGKSEINANPKDTKDYEDGVWDLPPTLRKGETDKDKYLGIGESDRMTLKFVKVAKKPAAKDDKKGDADKKGEKN